MSTPLEMVLISKSELLAIIQESVTSCLGSLQKSNESNDRPSQLLSRKEAAGFLGISLPTLDSHTQKGSLKARYIGRRILYEEKELLSATFTLKSAIGYKKTGHRNGR